MTDVLISSAAKAGPNAFPNLRTVFQMTSGALVALVQPASGTTKAYVSLDGGTTWDSGTALPSSTIDLKDAFASRIVTIAGTDYLAIWLRGTSVSGPDVTLYRATWDGVSSFTAATSQTYTALNHGGQNLKADAAWVDADGRWYVVLADVQGTSHTVSAFATDGSATFHASSPIWTGSTWDGVSILAASGGIVTVAIGHAALGQTLLLPATYVGTSWTADPSAAESVSISSAPWLAYDASGNIDAVYSRSGALYTRKRTATGIYSSEKGLAYQNPSDLSFSGSYEPSTNTLALYYSSSDFITNGEIWCRRRIGSQWFDPQRIAGGTDAGFVGAKAAATILSGATDLTYQVGTTTPNSVYCISAPTAAAPNTPDSLSPTGFISTLVPTLSGRYSNLSASDPIASIQARTYSPDASTLTWDSGEVAVSTPAIAYGGPGLSYGQTVWFQLRFKDTILNRWSTWSSLSSFTPSLAGGLQIDAILCDGVESDISPVTITSNTFETEIEWTQPDGHPGATAQALLFAADGTTLLASGPVESGTLSVVSSRMYAGVPPIVAPGGTAVSASGPIISFDTGGALLSDVTDDKRFLEGQRLLVTDGVNTEKVTVVSFPAAQIVRNLGTALQFQPGDAARFSAGDPVIFRAATVEQTLYPPHDPRIIDHITGDWVYLTSAVSFGGAGSWMYGPSMVVDPPLVHSYTAPDLSGLYLFPNWTVSRIVDGGSYRLRAVVTDAISGVPTESTAWDLEAHFTVPAPITGATIDVEPDLGVIVFRWDVLAAGLYAVIRYRLAGTTEWLTPLGRNVFTGLGAVLFAYPELVFDYQVTVYNASGTPSSATQFSDIALDGKAGTYSVWLNDMGFDGSDISAMLVYSAALGGMVSDSSSTGLDSPDDKQGGVTHGAKVPSWDFRTQDYVSATGRQFWLPNSDVDLSGNDIDALDVIGVTRALVKSHHILLYRDPDGHSFTIVASAFHAERADTIHYMLGFDMDQQGPHGARIVSLEDSGIGSLPGGGSTTTGLSELGLLVLGESSA